ncbi:MAG: selenocysteine-specific translation elongation factor [Bacillaceae bacterium]|nr:selenocysteine-specific translation elongation factor [Bacillaceae bacterium]
MERHYTIGIAGHIDHGKTTLTRKLTDVDTDRLKEEKERNISIELGFAPFSLPDGKRVSIVDVPGHERFVRQMIAGVAGIDLVLLVIAADEGIMPQTREHSDILQFLGVKNGIVVITKTDLVDDEWLQLVQDEVENWMKETSFADMPVIPVSAETGEGVDRLVVKIQEMLSDLLGRDASGPFRLPIDRVFTKKGIGTVVTGTVYQGSVSEGDRLELLPNKQEVKVRQVHVHNEQKKQAFAGQRTALNLSGIDLEEIQRGDTLVSPGYFEATERIDIRFQMLKDLSFSVKQRSRVRIHTATSEVIGKIIFFDRNELLPGDEVYAQLDLEEPLVVKKGDPFILRRLSPVDTIGGGQVLDPYAEKYRFGQATVEKLKQKAQDDPLSSLRTFIQDAGYATVQQAARHLAVDEDQVAKWVEQFVEQGSILYFADEQYIVDRTGLGRWEEQIRSVLEDYHEKHPMRAGLNKAEMKSRYFSGMPEKLWHLFLDYEQEREFLRSRDEWVSLYSFEPEVPGSLAAKAEQVVQKIESAGIKVPDWKAVAGEVGIPAKDMDDLKNYLIYKGTLLPLTEDMVISRRVFDEKVSELAASDVVKQPFTPAEAKTVLDVSRKYLIPFLELLDTQGYTVRHDNKRKWVGA